MDLKMKNNNPSDGDISYDSYSGSYNCYVDDKWVTIDRRTMTDSPKWEWCDDLEAPQICVIMDVEWWVNTKDQIIPWLKEHGCDVKTTSMSSGMLHIPDPALRTLFALKWS